MSVESFAIFREKVVCLSSRYSVEKPELENTKGKAPGK